MNEDQSQSETAAGRGLYEINQAAVSVQNARLYAEARGRLSELSTVIDVARVVSSSLDLEGVLAAGAEHLKQTLQAAACTILLDDYRRRELRRAAARGAPIGPDTVSIRNETIEVIVDRTSGCFRLVDRSSGQSWEPDPWQGAAGILVLDRTGAGHQTGAPRECDSADSLGDVGRVHDAEVVHARGAVQQGRLTVYHSPSSPACQVHGNLIYGGQNLVSLGCAVALASAVAAYDLWHKPYAPALGLVAGCRFLASSEPLGARLNTAAASTRTPWLMFLRAGVVPEPGWVGATERFIDMTEFAGGPRAAVFRPPGITDLLRPGLAEIVNLVRAALGGARPEQGLLISRRLYESIGGHPAGDDAERLILRRIGRRRLTMMPVGAWAFSILVMTEFMRDIPVERPITVRNLYTHTGGLWGHWGDSMNDMEEVVADYYPYLAADKLSFYNGAGNSLGSKIIETITGEAVTPAY